MTERRSQDGPARPGALDVMVPPDTGCHVHPACLTCPLPRCVYDETKEEYLASVSARDAEIYAAAQQQQAEDGYDVMALARQFGVSRRTIHRAIARIREQSGSPQ